MQIEFLPGSIRFTTEDKEEIKILEDACEIEEDIHAISFNKRHCNFNNSIYYEMRHPIPLIPIKELRKKTLSH